jgi:Tol biopolymer transport system component
MPDGEHLLYGSWRAGGLSNVYAQRVDGSGPAQRLSDSPLMQLPSGLTPDGSSVLFTQVSAQGYDLYMLRLDSGEAVPLLATPRDERNAVISPDMRWIAYESNSANAPGRLDVYVRPFPVTDDGGVWQVSAGGGTHPLWSRNGDELFYLSADGAMVAVPVETSGDRWIGSAPVRLFDGPYYIRTADLSRHYDVTADGQRFLMIRDTPTNSMPVRIVLVQNFAEELKARVPR